MLVIGIYMQGLVVQILLRGEAASKVWYIYKMK